MFWIPLFMKNSEGKIFTDTVICETFDEAVKTILSRHPSAAEYYYTEKKEWVKI